MRAHVRWRGYRVAPLAALAATALAAVAPAMAALPAQARVRSEIRSTLDLHQFLISLGRAAENAPPEYLNEARAYQQARELSADPSLWRRINDLLVENKGVEGVRRLAGSPPAALAAPEREALVRIAGALETAWPRYEAHNLMDRNRSLQRVLTGVLRRQFSQALEERIMSVVYEKMAFAPLDAPITIFPVLDAAEIGQSGKTSLGYYLIMPAARRESLVFLEGVVHELTHLLDSNQPPGSRSVLSALRARASRADPGNLEAFLHGLVAWNAGEMIRRVARPGYRPLNFVSLELKEQALPFVPTYEGPWSNYLDGKLTREQAIEGMLGALVPPESRSPGGSTPVP